MYLEDSGSATGWSKKLYRCTMETLENGVTMTAMTFTDESEDKVAVQHFDGSYWSWRLAVAAVANMIDQTISDAIKAGELLSDDDAERIRNAFIWLDSVPHEQYQARIDELKELFAAELEQGRAEPARN